MLYQLSYEAKHWEQGLIQSFQIWIISYILRHRRYELNKLTSLQMWGFIAQFVEYHTGIAEVTSSNPAEALIFHASSFQVLKLENLVPWSFFTFIYKWSSNMNNFIQTSHHYLHFYSLWPKSRKRVEILTFVVRIQLKRVHDTKGDQEAAD